MDSDQALDTCLRRLCEAGFIDLPRACPYLGVDEPYSEELLDAFACLPQALRDEVFCFFDAEFYAGQHMVALPEGTNPLEHFLRYGLAARLAPHPLIDPRWMIIQRPDLFAPTIDLHRFVEAISRDWCDPSPFLWLTWYRGQARLPASRPALLHYLREGAATNRPPNPYFDPPTYIAAARDAPRRGLALVKHFLATGDRALVAASERFDTAWYQAQHGAAIAEGSGPLQHFLAVGRFEGHAARDLVEVTPGRALLSAATADIAVRERPHQIADRYAAFHAEIAAAHRARVVAFEQRDICAVRIEDHAAALKALRFPVHAQPDIDVLIPVHDEFEVTVECLVALANAAGSARLRVVVVDDASPDKRLRLLRQVPGLVVIRHRQNLHFLLSCNRAYAQCHAPFLLLLNNDTQVLEGAIDTLFETIAADASIGAVAPMFLYPNGRLQEAGCTLRHDGDSTMIGVGEDPDRPCYGRPRDIQYGSGAGLLLRRAAVGSTLFDERFAPAYCEDADLCLRLREGGWRILYQPKARIIHHLSVSTKRTSQRRRVQMVRRNQDKLAAKWAVRLREENRARVLAFYLPQFHPIPRNDVWWGRGFTEWTNVTRAVPSFEGHYQPHLPSDLGFYDLRRVEVMDEQQRLASRYGIDGFVVYYYNFGAARILDQPMETLLRHPEVPFRFALCWANENWTRHWDGGERAMLLEQSYDAATLDSVAADLVRFAADPRALRVKGKPLVLIYRPLLVPDVAAVAARLRQRFAEAGEAAIHLVYVESMEALQRRMRPADIGFDACVEFPPQGVGEALLRTVAPLKAGFDGSLYDYAGTARNAILRQTVDYLRYPAVVPSWDNTARQPLKGTTLVDAEPELFQAYAEHKLEEMLNFTEGEERLLFVNAWNEWAEGAHLEPDRTYGHRWLTALRNARLAKGIAS